VCKACGCSRVQVSEDSFVCPNIDCNNRGWVESAATPKEQDFEKRLDGFIVAQLTGIAGAYVEDDLRIQAALNVAKQLDAELASLRTRLSGEINKAIAANVMLEHTRRELSEALKERDAARKARTWETRCPVCNEPQLDLMQEGSTAKLTGVYCYGCNTAFPLNPRLSTPVSEDTPT
jgi:hypothetical protein